MGSEKSKQPSVADIEELLHVKRGELLNMRKSHKAAYSDMCDVLDKANYRTVRERTDAIKPHDEEKKRGLEKAKALWESSVSAVESKFEADIGRLKALKSEELAKIDASYREARVKITDEFVRVSEKLYAEYTQAIKEQTKERHEKLEELSKAQAQTMGNLEREIEDLEKQVVELKRG